MVKEQEDEIEEFETMKEDWLEMLDRLEKMSRKCEEDAKLENGQYLDNKTVKEVGYEDEGHWGWARGSHGVSRKEQLESSTTKKNGDMEEAMENGAGVVQDEQDD